MKKIPNFQNILISPPLTMLPPEWSEICKLLRGQRLLLELLSFLASRPKLECVPVKNILIPWGWMKPGFTLQQALRGSGEGIFRYRLRQLYLHTCMPEVGVFHQKTELCRGGP